MASEFVLSNGRRFEHHLAGGSKVISPNGDILAEVDPSTEGVAWAEVDPAAAAEARQRLGPLAHPLTARGGH
jgi:predicted amidohydrolase